MKYSSKYICAGDLESMTKTELKALKQAAENQLEQRYKQELLKLLEEAESQGLNLVVFHPNGKMNLSADWYKGRMKFCEYK